MKKTFTVIVLIVIASLFSCKNDYECTETYSYSTADGSKKEFTYVILYEDVSYSQIKDIENVSTYKNIDENGEETGSYLTKTCEKR